MDSKFYCEAIKFVTEWTIDDNRSLYQSEIEDLANRIATLLEKFSELRAQVN